MGLLATTLVACGSDPDKRCVDPDTHKLLPDSRCKPGGTGHYYYGGSVSHGRVSGGSYSKSAVKSGGFGGGRHGSSGG
ncbi:hypothetical protein LCE31_36165 [Streptomyces sp. 8L]|nr:hypothetical protein [Streptomyces sp. 8L]MCA1223700.1 hypothetical protein [Streptomyces sp. 8L]